MTIVSPCLASVAGWGLVLCSHSACLLASTDIDLLWSLRQAFACSGRFDRHLPALVAPAGSQGVSVGSVTTITTVTTIISKPAPTRASYTRDPTTCITRNWGGHLTTPGPGPLSAHFHTEIEPGPGHLNT